jgi:DNA-binding NtrC family response regulator
VDLRIIAATNKDLAEEVAAGNFREDLFYRLSVIPVHLPPLHERREDIPLLTRHFLKGAAVRHSIPEKGLTLSALKALTNARYPGNVRQLQNVVEQAAIMSEGETVDLDDLPLEVREARGGIMVEVPPEESDLKSVLKAVTELAERQVIGRVLDEVEGNRTKAAERLGISRRGLINKIQELRL